MVLSSTQLKNELEHHVHTRTGRRVLGLEIQVFGEAVVLRGHARTYYVKQLAQHGVQDMMPQVHLENAIVVDALN